MGAVVAREPDLVHAIVEADDAVLRHVSQIVDNALRRQRKTASITLSVGGSLTSKSISCQRKRG
jgi:hypothetical protein